MKSGNYPLEGITSEAHALNEGMRQDLRKRLFIWCVRWTLGFAIFAVFTHFYPDISWPWYVGIGIATLSLIVLLSMGFTVQRKAQQLMSSIEEASPDIEQTDDRSWGVAGSGHPCLPAFGRNLRSLDRRGNQA